MAETTSKAVINAQAPGLDRAQVLKASTALLRHIHSEATTTTQSGKRNLLADADQLAAETPIWLTVTTKKHITDTNRLQPKKVAIPHSLNTDEDTSICLIVADPQRYYKDLVASDEFPADLKRITRVIDTTHLAKKYRAYEAQRALASEHGVFLADTRIINRLPKLLGKVFYKTTAKRPVPVQLLGQRERGSDGKKIKREGKKKKRDPAVEVNARPLPEMIYEIKKALNSALVHLSPSTNTAIRVGYAGWPPEHVTDNVMKISAELVDKFVPQKWTNIRSIYIKGPNTTALPIYLAEELWTNESEVVPDDQAPAKLLPGDTHKKDKKQGTEKANVGKKRKSADANASEPERASVSTVRSSKKARKGGVGESNDEALDQQIAKRKAALKKQKKAAAAKAAVELS